MNETAILVVDDDAPIRRMLDRTLAAEGYAVESAADGGEALAAVERSAPDLIVLDVSMPGLDGLAVCRRLRAKGLATPVLLLTARDEVPDRVAGLDAGADDYLVKPFATDELLARVRALLRRHAPEELLALADLTFDPATRSVRRGGREVDPLAARGRPARAAAAQRAAGRIARAGDRTDLAGRNAREHRRSRRDEPPPQARRAAR